MNLLGLNESVGQRRSTLERTRKRIDAGKSTDSRNFRFYIPSRIPGVLPIVPTLDSRAGYDCPVVRLTRGLGLAWASTSIHGLAFNTREQRDPGQGLPGRARTASAVLRSLLGCFTFTRLQGPGYCQRGSRVVRSSGVGWERLGARHSRHSVGTLVDPPAAQVRRSVRCDGRGCGLSLPQSGQAKRSRVETVCEPSGSVDPTLSRGRRRVRHFDPARWTVDLSITDSVFGLVVFSRLH